MYNNKSQKQEKQYTQIKQNIPKPIYQWVLSSMYDIVCMITRLTPRASCVTVHLMQIGFSQ